MKLYLLLFLSGIFVLNYGNNEFDISTKPQISCKVSLDTSKWESKAYLSMISNFSEMNTISYNRILQESTINSDGQFSFSTGDLDTKEQLYRIHISKKGDPAASLSIGGKDHNHLFFIAKQNEKIKIHSFYGSSLFNELKIEGNQANSLFIELNEILSLLDTLNLYGTDMSRDFIREATSTKLLDYADTCSHKLVAQYALYKSGVDVETKSSWWKIMMIIVIVIGFLIGILQFTGKLIPKNKNPLSNLTIQERKIYALLKEGKSNKEIAEECSISISTVKSHVNNVYSKLGVSSRKEVVDI